jgi:glycosyltransferase involved in cell wall biosynthesis
MSLSLSVVTPSLNQGRFIERTIRSVLDQGYAPLQHIVCDGGSTDDTLTILERYGDQLTVVSEHDGGQAAAVNKGIQRTSGEIIGWLNSDDVYCPGALAAVAQAFETSPEVDVIYGDADLLDQDDIVLRAYYTEPWNAARLAARCFLCQPAVFFRRSVIDRFGLLDERLHFCLDYEYWLRLAMGQARFKYVPKVLAGSRLHTQAKTLRARLAFHHEINTMLRQKLGYVPDSWLLNTAHTQVELERADGHALRVPYALEVVGRSLALSLRWNGRISSHMLGTALAPAMRGAALRLRSPRSAPSASSSVHS